MNLIWGWNQWVYLKHKKQQICFWPRFLDFWEVVVAGAGCPESNGVYLPKGGVWKDENCEYSIGTSPFGAGESTICPSNAKVWWISGPDNTGSNPVEAKGTHGLYFNCADEDKNIPPLTGWKARAQNDWTWSVICSKLDFPTLEIKGNEQFIVYVASETTAKWSVSTDLNCIPDSIK